MFLDAIWSLGSRIESSTNNAVRNANPEFDQISENQVFHEIMEDVAQGNRATNSRFDSNRYQARISRHEGIQAMSNVIPAQIQQQRIQINGSYDSQSKILNKQNFLDKILPYAQQAGKKLGINPLFIVSQAVLETGWGQKLISDQHGHSANNIFGIKAGNYAQRIRQLTHEFENGQMVSKIEHFQKFNQISDAFDAYVNLLKNNRHIQSLQYQNPNIETFSHAVQKMGYATDPAYSKKLMSVFDSINHMVKSNTLSIK